MSVSNEHRDALLAALNLLTEDVKKGRVNLAYEVSLVFKDGASTISYRPENPVGTTRLEYKR
jgi:hypothetical protein